MESSLSDTADNSHLRHLPWPIYDKHAKIIKVNKHDNFIHYQIECIHCRKSLNIDSRSTSNFRKHLSTSHHQIIKEIDKLLFSNKNRKRKIDCDINLELKSTQLSIDEVVISQKFLDTMILNCVISASLPFRIVENENFQVLIKAGFRGKQVMSRSTLMQRMNTTVISLREKLMLKLSTISYVATTADCWSIQKRSYLGITGHWIDESSYKRISCLLAIRRIKGRHTYDVLAQLMESVYLEFEIITKVCFTTTDKGSNFVKDFNVFGISNNSHNQENVPPEAACSDDKDDNCNDSSDSDTDESDNEKAQYISVQDVVTNSTIDKSIEYNLPKHGRCTAHTLNLIATTDCKSAFDNKNFKSQMRSAFAKCQALWNKQNRSSLVADLIFKELGKYLTTPNDTRWNATYDSLICLANHLSDKEHKLRLIWDELKIPKLNKNDITFISEYLQVMKPIVYALDILQGEKTMYLGFLLPVLKEIKIQFKKLEKKSLIYCKCLIEVLTQALDTRFSNKLKDEELLLASITNPCFKLEWLENEQEKDSAAITLKRALKIVIELKNSNIGGNVNNNNTCPVDEATPNKKVNSFFSWVQKSDYSQNPSIQTLVENEVFLFVSSPIISVDNLNNMNNGLDCLNNTPNIKSLLLKYNTPLPSSAPVERLFSVAGCIFTKRRGRMSDENFEKTLF